MLVRDVAAALESIAPLSYAETWDKVGLHVGRGDARVRRALLTIDLTDEVLREAMTMGADFVVAYHPPIFAPIERLTDTQMRARVVLGAAEAGIAVFSPHTALDAAPGGINDWLAGGLGPGTATPLAAHRAHPPGERYKIVTFCPAADVEAVRSALSAAGAGSIGAYAECSFELTGHGTFRGDAGTSPRAGRQRAGIFDRVEETRLEMVCGATALDDVVAALVAAHPYETPAYDVYALVPRAVPGVGTGRAVHLERGATLAELIECTKKRLRVKHLQVATARGAPRRYRAVGLCAGAGSGLIAAARAAGCEAFLTGEMRHHDVIEAQAEGLTILLAGHTNTERGYLPTLRTKLRRALPQLDIAIAKTDRDPLVVK